VRLSFARAHFQPSAIFGRLESFRPHFLVEFWTRVLFLEVILQFPPEIYGP